MKKIIAILMVVFMLVSMAACGETAGNGSDNNGSDAGKTTVGQTLLADFKANSTGTTEEIANRLVTNEIIQFAGAAIPVEEGFLSGFDNVEIKGFKEGAMFAPMIGSIAFVGYVFELADDADVEAFKTTLKDSANLRWNICVAAEELVVESEGNKVFFVMCPESFEQPETEGDNVFVDDEDMIPAEDGITLD